MNSGGIIGTLKADGWSRRAGALLALLAILVNLFGWTLLPDIAQASDLAATADTSTSSIVQANICHADDLTDAQAAPPPDGKPFCIQCFPLLSAASGAMAPTMAALPVPQPIRGDAVLPISRLPAHGENSIVYPARAPPAWARA